MMTSKIAKDAFEQLIGEGLSPTFDDAVALNDAGLRVERDGGVAEFVSVPRAAFLGDLVLWEPSIRKRSWIEDAGELLADNYATRMCLTAFALNTPDDDLPRLDSVRRLTKAVETFRDEKLAPFAETQILAAIEYALVGRDDPNDGESPSTPPDGVMSAARSMLAQVYAVGGGAGAESLTLPALERIVALAVMAKGADVLADSRRQAIGKFYVTVGKIRSRLKDEKEAK